MVVTRVLLRSQCNGGSDGSITFSASGGTGTLQYSLDGGTYQLSGTFTDLSAGSHTVTVKDGHSCTNTQTVVWCEPSATTLEAATPVERRCNGGSDGSITFSASGGTGTLQYSLDGGTYQLSGTFTDLSAGSHTVTVKDEIGRASCRERV